MGAFSRSLQSLGLLIARLGLGGLLMLHGFNRWLGTGQGVAKQVAYLQQFGTPYPQVAAWGGIILELVGGLFLILGALTPIVAAAILVEQVLIVCYTNWYRGTEVLRNDLTNTLTLEHNLVVGLLALLFVVFGGGAISIDRLFRRKKVDAEDEDDVRTTARVPLRTAA